MTCDVIDWSTQKARWRGPDPVCLYGRRPLLSYYDGRMTWSRDLIAADSLFNSMLHMEDTDGTTASDPSRHWVDHDV